MARPARRGRCRLSRGAGGICRRARALDQAMTREQARPAIRIPSARAARPTFRMRLPPLRIELRGQRRDQVALDWAMITDNLAQCAARAWRARQRHGAAGRGGRRLSRGTCGTHRERAPLDWAKTQYDLGDALFSLGKRENGTARLEEAAAAYRAALEVYTRVALRSTGPRRQSNLGKVLQTLGERENGTAGWRRRSLPTARRWRNRIASACRLSGPDPGQSRRRAAEARRARERHGAAGTGDCRLSRGAGGIHPRARAAGMGGGQNNLGYALGAWRA